MITTVRAPTPSPEPPAAPPVLVGALPDPAFAPPVIRPKRKPAVPTPDPWFERWTRLARALKRAAPHGLTLGYLFLGGLLCGAVVGTTIRTALPGKAYSFSLNADGQLSAAPSRKAESVDVEIAKAKAELDAALAEVQK